LVEGEGETPCKTSRGKKVKKRESSKWKKSGNSYSKGLVAGKKLKKSTITGKTRSLDSRYKHENGGHPGEVMG